MKVMILGDLHEDVETVDRIIEENKPDFVLSTGDLGLYKAYNIPFYFIYGNHEIFDIIEAMDKNKLKFENLMRIKTAEIITLRKGEDSIKVSGINGNYSPNYKERKRHFTREDVQRCMRLKDIDMFLSHEAPSGIGFEYCGKDLGIEPVKEILDRVKPKYFFFGHHHHFWQKDYKGTKVIGLQRPKDGFVMLYVSRNEIKDSLIIKSF